MSEAVRTVNRNRTWAAIVAKKPMYVAIMGKRRLKAPLKGKGARVLRSGVARERWSEGQQLC